MNKQNHIAKQTERNKEKNDKSIKKEAKAARQKALEEERYFELQRQQAIKKKELEQKATKQEAPEQEAPEQEVFKLTYSQQEVIVENLKQDDIEEKLCKKKASIQEIVKEVCEQKKVLEETLEQILLQALQHAILKDGEQKQSFLQAVHNGYGQQQPSSSLGGRKGNFKHLQASFRFV
jgi:uncharacterized protein (DUF849 family)